MDELASKRRAFPAGRMIGAVLALVACALAVAVGAVAVGAVALGAAQEHGTRRARLPRAGEALPGRATPMATLPTHRVLGTPLAGALPDGLETAYFAMGCFWGAERRFWETSGVRSTAVGYMGGATPNPTYEEVCSGDTGHAETVRVWFDPRAVSYEALLRVFWEGHDPTQGMRQGADVGTQYRSALFVTSARQRLAAEASRRRYAERLRAAGFGEITTEVRDAGAFYVAEAYHQQYLAAHPDGYCGHGGTGVSCPIGLPEATDP